MILFCTFWFLSQQMTWHLYLHIFCCVMCHSMRKGCLHQIADHNILKSMLKLFYMFMIKIYYKDNNITRGISTKCINIKKLGSYELKNGNISETIPVFVKSVVFQNIGISWIIESKELVKFIIEEQCCSCIVNGHWYNTTFFSHLIWSDF